MAAELNLTIEKKSAFQRRLIYKDSNGRAINLTGWTAKLQIKPAADSVTVLIELSTTNGRIALGGNAGFIDLYVSVADTTSIAWTTGVYDLLLTPADGKSRRLVQGTMTASPGVTA